MSIINPNNIPNFTPLVTPSETSQVEEGGQLPAPVFADQVSVADYTPEQRNQAAINVPSLPPPDHAADSNFNVGKALDESSWFSGNCLVNLAFVMQEMQRINRDGALQLGLQEAELIQLSTDLYKEIAHLVKKNYQEQAKMAMFEIIGASVGLAMSTASLGITIGGAAAGGIAARRASGGQPVAEAEVSPSGKPASAPEAPVADKPAAKPNTWEGAAQGVGLATRFAEPLSQIGTQLDKIITAIGKLHSNEALAIIESEKTRLQAAADLIKKATETIDQETRSMLEHNDQIRNYLKTVFEERTRMFGSITGHGA